MPLLAEVGTLVSPTTNGSQTVSLSSAIWGGATPKCLLIWGSQNPSDGIIAYGALAFGVALSSSNRVYISTYSADNVSTTNEDRRTDNADLIGLLAGSGTPFEAADFTSFGVEEFTINWNPAFSTAYAYNWMALGGDDLEFDLMEIDSAASTGNQAYTGVGFQPDALIAFGVHASGATPNSDTTAAFNIGFSDGTNEHCTSLIGWDNRSTAESSRLQKSKLIAHTNVFGTADFRIENEANVASLDSDGFTLNWSVVAGTTRKIQVLSIKGASFKVLNGLTMPTSDGNETRTGIGFTPKAALITTAMDEASASVQTNGKFGIGAWDSANNQAFAGMLMEDSVSTTNTDRAQNDGAAIKHYDHTPQAMGSMTLSASGDNLVEAWTVDDNGLYEFEHGALVMGDAAAAPSESTNKSACGIGVGLGL